MLLMRLPTANHIKAKTTCLPKGTKQALLALKPTTQHT